MERILVMARRCELTGVGAQSGHKVSHSNRKSNVKFLPNLQRVSLYSDTLRRDVHLRVTAATLRTVDKNGGLDSYLLTAFDNHLTEEARRLKRRIKRMQAKAAA
jgi:large subunit ribosomal protein L28